MATFVLPISCGWGGCVDICTSHANGGGSVTRAKRIRVEMHSGGILRRWETGMCGVDNWRDRGGIKLLMSDGSKQVQLNFDNWEWDRGEWVSEFEQRDEEEARRERTH